MQQHTDSGMSPTEKKQHFRHSLCIAASSLCDLRAKTQGTVLAVKVTIQIPEQMDEEIMYVSIGAGSLNTSHNLDLSNSHLLFFFFFF